MKYKKGTFAQVPNIPYLRGKPNILQVIFLWICVHADEDGVCYPSRKLLSDEVNCDIRTVDKYIKMLEQDGVIIKTKRSKPRSKENFSNLYQIMQVAEPVTLPSEPLYTTPSEPNVPVTISSVNYTNITNSDTVVSPEQEDNFIPVKANKTSVVKPSVAGQLPDRFGSTPAIRFLEAYKMFYRYYFDVEYKEIGRIETLSKIKRFLSDKTEQQGIALLNLYFNWGGIGSNENNKLKAIFFPLGIFFYHENNYVTTFRKECDLYNYDKPERVKAYLDFYAKDILKRT